jgi:predicted esterase
MLDMKKIEIETKKTGRYFQLGEFNDNTKNVIVACHGYAQLANYFLKWFETPKIENTVIIAPEGLNRFYWEGFSGNVVASWMTKEDRSSDIEDYIFFLDNILKSLPLNDKIKINALGFSQGAATVARWVEKTNYPIENLILWAGVFPEDVPLQTLNQKLKYPIQVLFGDNDQFFSSTQIEAYKEKIMVMDTKMEFTMFEGQHKIYKEPLHNLYKKLNIN